MHFCIFSVLDIGSRIYKFIWTNRKLSNVILQFLIYWLLHLKVIRIGTSTVSSQVLWTLTLVCMRYLFSYAKNTACKITAKSLNFIYMVPISQFLLEHFLQNSFKTNFEIKCLQHLFLIEINIDDIMSYLFDISFLKEISFLVLKQTISGLWQQLGTAFGSDLWNLCF